MCLDDSIKHKFEVLYALARGQAQWFVSRRAMLHLKDDGHSAGSRLTMETDNFLEAQYSFFIFHIYAPELHDC